MRYIVDNIPAPIMTGNKNRTERILQNCKNLIMTMRGEVPFDRLRGLETELHSMSMAKLREKLTRSLDTTLMYEPYAELVSAKCSLQEDGELYIEMVIEIEEDA